MYNFINLNPELVEKKEPPIITNNKKMKLIFSGILSKENPILETLLDNENNM